MTTHNFFTQMEIVHFRFQSNDETFNCFQLWMTFTLLWIDQNDQNTTDSVKRGKLLKISTFRQHQLLIMSKKNWIIIKFKMTMSDPVTTYLSLQLWAIQTNTSSFIRSLPRAHTSNRYLCILHIERQCGAMRCMCLCFFDQVGSEHIIEVLIIITTWLDSTGFFVGSFIRSVRLLCILFRRIRACLSDGLVRWFSLVVVASNISLFPFAVCVGLLIWILLWPFLFAFTSQSSQVESIRVQNENIYSDHLQRGSPWMNSAFHSNWCWYFDFPNKYYDFTSNASFSSNRSHTFTHTLRRIPSTNYHCRLIRSPCQESHCGIPTLNSNQVSSSHTMISQSQKCHFGPKIGFSSLESHTTTKKEQGDGKGSPLRQSGHENEISSSDLREFAEMRCFGFSNGKSDTPKTAATHQSHEHPSDQHVVLAKSKHAFELP